MLDERDEVVSIDGQIIGLSPNNGREEYLRRVRRLLLDSSGAKPSREFEAVRASLQMHTQINVGADGALRMQEGFWQVVRQAPDIGTALRSEMDEWHALLAQFEPPLSDLPQIQTDFVDAVWSLFVQAANGELQELPEEDEEEEEEKEEGK